MLNSQLIICLEKKITQKMKLKTPNNFSSLLNQEMQIWMDFL